MRVPIRSEGPADYLMSMGECADSHLSGNKGSGIFNLWSDPFVLAGDKLVPEVSSSGFCPSPNCVFGEE